MKKSLTNTNREVGKPNICFVSSTGGHLYQLHKLSTDLLCRKSFWVTFDKLDANSLLGRKTKKFFAHYPESRKLINAWKNLFLAGKILKQERPDVVISCGAGIAPPFFAAAKIMGIHTIYIEPMDFIQKPSLTGVISQYLVDLFLVQHPSQKKFFRRKVHYWGSILDL